MRRNTYSTVESGFRFGEGIEVEDSREKPEAPNSRTVYYVILLLRLRKDVGKYGAVLILLSRVVLF